MTIIVGVIAVCDVERLDDLERSKQEALREKEKMKYGAVSSRKKEFWYRQVTSSSTSSVSPASSTLITSKDNDREIFEKDLNIISSSIPPIATSLSSSSKIDKIFSKKNDDIRETSPRHNLETKINRPSEATQTLSRAVASLLFSLSSFGVDFLQLPEESQKSIWRGIEIFGKGKLFSFFFFFYTA